MADEKKRSWFKFLTILSIFMAGFLVVVFTVLSSLGGDSDVLKGAIEEFASEFTGYPAQVGKLNSMNFYPYLSVDMNGFELLAKDEGDETLLYADKVQAAMGFWDSSFTTGRFKSLNIENLEARPGIILDKSVSMNRLALIHDEGQKPGVLGHGHIGAAPWSLNIDVEMTGGGAHKKYYLPERRTFRAELENMKVTGIWIDTSYQEKILENIKLLTPEASITGALEFMNIDDETAELKIDLEIEPRGDTRENAHENNGVALQADLMIHHKTTPVLVTGTWNGEELKEKALVLDILSKLQKRITEITGLLDHPITWDIETQNEEY